MKYISTILFLLLLFTSCKKTIDIKLKDADKRIVIDARLISGVNDFNVQITKSANFFGEGTRVSVADASVILLDDINTYHLTNMGEGNYSIPLFTALESKKYKLSVTSEGAVYEASSATLSKIELVEVSYIFEEATIFSDNGFTIYTKFQDPKSEVNYYIIDGTVNGKKFGGVDNLILFDDVLENGDFISSPVLGELKLGDVIVVNLYHVNLSTYNYYKGLELILNEESDNAAPTNPVNNWNNNVLGNFSTMAVSSKMIVIQ
jgi:hypothetical protein